MSLIIAINGKSFLALLNAINFENKKVLEVGSGPGGNLYEISFKNPAALHGVDISEVMISISQKLLSGKKITLQKIDGLHLPYADQYFHLTFTSTVLQHITDEAMLHQLIGEICRATSEDIYLFERIERTIKGNDLNLGRPVKYYKQVLGEFGFTLSSVKFLNIQVSYFVAGAIRKLFNVKGKKEGEPPSKISKLLQKISLPLTSQLDKIIKLPRELGVLHFKRTKPVKKIVTESSFN